MSNNEENTLFPNEGIISHLWMMNRVRFPLYLLLFFIYFIIFSPGLGITSKNSEIKENL